MDNVNMNNLREGANACHLSVKIFTDGEISRIFLNDMDVSRMCEGYTLTAKPLDPVLLTLNLRADDFTMQGKEMKVEANIKQ